MPDESAYDDGHIPGAIFLDLDTDLADEHGYGAPGRHPLPSPHEFERRLGAAGIGSDDFVVAYDDLGGTIAARLWWMLDDLGHRGAAVLERWHPGLAGSGLRTFNGRATPCAAQRSRWRPNGAT